jgi:choline transport protein
MVSSPEWAPFAAFFNGWMSIFGWWLDCSAVVNPLAGTESYHVAFIEVADVLVGMILALATLWYPDYQIQNYRQYLVYVLVIWLAIAVIRLRLSNPCAV